MKAISDARTCKDGCKYVRERLQVRAGKVASISVEDAVHCVFFPQTFASFASNVCNSPCKALQPPS